MPAPISIHKEIIMEQLNELEAALQIAVAKLSEARHGMTGDEVRQAKNRIRLLRRQIQDILTAGVEPCPECGNMPLGIHQPKYFFVGCLSPSCSERRSRGDSVSLAVMAWNAQVYFPRAAARLALSR
jgi:hypothetical protein